MASLNEVLETCKVDAAYDLGEVIGLLQDGEQDLWDVVDTLPEGQEKQDILGAINDVKAAIVKVVGAIQRLDPQGEQFTEGEKQFYMRTDSRGE